MPATTNTTHVILAELPGEDDVFMRTVELAARGTEAELPGARVDVLEVHTDEDRAIIAALAGKAHDARVDAVRAAWREATR